jgi:hypothetical protein
MGRLSVYVALCRIMLASVAGPGSPGCRQTALRGTQPVALCRIMSDKREWPISKVGEGTSPRECKLVPDEFRRLPSVSEWRRWCSISTCRVEIECFGMDFSGSIPATDGHPSIGLWRSNRGQTFHWANGRCRRARPSLIEGCRRANTF